MKKKEKKIILILIKKMYHQYFLEKWENLEDDQVLENFTLSNLITEYSPTLPEDFPKEKLPSKSFYLLF